MRLRSLLKREVLLSLIFLSVALPFAAAAQPVQRQFLHGHVPDIIHSLRPLGQMNGTNQLNLAIELPLQNSDALTELLQQLYDPASPQYHHYLTPASFAQRFGPTEQDYQAVMAFVRSNGLRVTATYSNRVLLDVKGRAADIERMLHLTLHTYRHPTENRTFYAPDSEPSLDLSVPILHIVGLDNYELPHPLYRRGPAPGQSKIAANGSGPGGNYAGFDFRNCYAPGVTLSGAGQTVALFEMDGYYPDDILYYEKTNGLFSYEYTNGLPGVILTNVLLGGATGVPGNPENVLEVSLDIEMAIAMAPGLSRLMVYEAPITSVGAYDILNQLATDDQAQQISSSWVIDRIVSTPVTNQIYLQYAAQGQSFFQASGDQDAYVPGTYQTADNPYITTVGGTTLTTTGPGGGYESESVWNDGVIPSRGWTGSGGGISTIFAIPTYQQGISMTANGGSTTMRNVPDVALTANNVYVRAEGADQDDVQGTSCAAPLWAGFSALINQQAAANGQPPMGFLNPAVYTVGENSNYNSCFHDITLGNNTNSSSANEFLAVPGYDLCTGWGTPAGQSLIDALMSAGDALGILPGAGFAAIGPIGGPFNTNSESFTLTNAVSGTLNWSAGPTANWLNVSPGAGMLTAGGAATVITVSLNSAANALAIGTYTNWLFFTNLTSGFVQSRQFTLEVAASNQSPFILVQPADVSVTVSNPATFSVQANGTPPLAYQWQFNGTNLAGANNSVLTLTNAQYGQAGSYSVLVSNPMGFIFSAGANLTVNPPPAAPAGIVSWWRAESNALDSVQNNNGVLVGTATYGPGKVGEAFVFDGSGDSAVQLGGPASLQLQNFTIEAWIKRSNVSASSLSGDSGIFLGHGTAGYGFGISNNGSLFLSKMDISSVTVPTGIADTGWHHVAVTRSGNEVIFYVDGTPWPAPPYSDVFASVFTMAIGARGDNLGDNFWGSIDELAVYNRALTTAEIQAIYNAGNAGKAPLPLASPAISVQPGSQTVSTGGSVLFSVTAGGTQPLQYQWQFNGTSLLDATNATLLLDNVQTNQAGYYSVLIANSVGSISSSNAVLTVNAASPSVPPPSGLVAWWQAEGNAADTLGNDNGTVIGSVGYAPGEVGLGFVFVGACGAVELGSPANLQLQNFTIEAWVKRASPTASSLTGDSAFFFDYGGTNTQSGGYGFGIQDNGQLFLAEAGNDGVAMTGSGITDTNWHHVAVAKNGTIVVFYVDGTAYSSSLDNTIYPFGIGASIGAQSSSSANSSSISQTFFGSIDELAVYNSALSASQIQAIYNAGSGGMTPPSPAIIVQPANQLAILTSNVTFSVSALGGQPLYYQWLFNGTNLQGATSATLVLPNIQFAQAGNYSVLITNVYGSVLSSTAVLSVYPLEPTILVQPASQVQTAGNPASFSVTAVGAAPLSYQWLFNGVTISGATNPVLALGPVQPVQAGNYSVWVTNSEGGILSSNAVLTVNPPPSCTPAPTNLVSWWPAEGDAWDATGCNNGAMTNAAYGPGEVGQAFVFEGENSSSVQLGLDRPSLELQNFTIEAWIQRASAQAVNRDAESGITNFNGQLFGYGLGGYAFFLGATNNQLHLGELGVNDVSAGMQITDTNWHYVAVTRAGSNVVFYVDGVAYAAPPYTNQFEFTSPVAIGARGDGRGNCFWGAIDELSVYSQALSPGQIQAIYDTYVTGKCPLPLAAPAFLFEPVSQTAVAGSQVVFSVTASGTPPINLQWQFDGTNIAGATNELLTLTNVQDAQAGAYSVVAGNAYGEATSSNAELTVVPPTPVTILFQPTNQAVGLGDTATFSVTASGSPPLGYQWQENGTNLAANGGPFYGTQTAALTISNVSETGTYYVIVSNSAGAVTSSNAVLTIIPAPPVITSQPSGNTALLGDIVDFSVGAVGSPLNYSWYLDGIQLTNNPDGSVSGADTSTLTLDTYSLFVDNVIICDDTLQAEVYNDQGAAYSVAVTFTVANPPVINTQPVNTVAPVGSTAILTCSASSPCNHPLTYQWVFDGQNVPGETNATLILPSVQLLQGGTYQLDVSDNLDIPPQKTESDSVTLDVGYSMVVAWGADNYGQTNVPFGLTNVIAVAAGYGHVLALKTNGTVAAWGDNGFGQCNVPSNLTNATAVAAGYGHSLALTNGTVAAWGYNFYGQCTVPSNLTNATAIAAGYGHSLALTANGTVVAWGWNVFGQTNVPVGLSNVVAIAAGYGHSLALKANGTVVAWGWNQDGQTNVPSNLTNVVAIAAGYADSLALMANGTVVAWGDDTYGQTTVPAGLSNVVSIAAGWYHNMALEANGTVTAWGLDNAGQANTPSALTNVFWISGGGSNSLAVVNGGGPVIVQQPLNQTIATGAQATFSVQAVGTAPMVYQWSFNGDKIMGATSPTLVLTNVQPDQAGNYTVQVVNGFGSAQSRAATLAVLGPPTITVQPGSQTVVQGDDVTLAVTAAGMSPLSYQWQFDGTNIAGATSATLALANVQLAQSGDYQVQVSNPFGSVSSDTAVLMVEQPPAITSQPAGNTALLGDIVSFNVGATGSPLSYNWYLDGIELTNNSDGSVSGANTSTLTLNTYQLYLDGVQICGDPVQAEVYNNMGAVYSSNALFTVQYQPVINTQPACAEILVGGSTTLSVGASVECNAPLTYHWYLDGYEERTTAPTLALSDAPAGTYTIYVRVLNGDEQQQSDTVTLSVGTSVVVPWGGDASGQTNIPCGLVNVTAISAGSDHNLALLTNRTVVAWGDNSENECNVPANLTNAAVVAAGNEFSLALKTNGTVIAWGDNAYGQCTVPSSLTNATTIAAGYGHSLALTASGTVVAWGWNYYGQTNVPAGLSNVVAIAAGYGHSLALTANGTVVAWGWNYYGQTNVPAGLSNVVAIAAGFGHSLALEANGTVVAWGLDNYGQTNVPAGLSNVVSIAAGWYHNLALEANGTVTAWGWNQTGQINVPAGLTNAIGISAGQTHSLALINTGVPAIVQQPWNQTVTAGQQVVFNVQALGNASLSYQWQFNGTNITGATNATLLLADVQPAQMGGYRVMVSNALGSALSSSAILTVLLPPAITVQPAGQTVVQGNDVTFAVTAFGMSPLGYQWQFNGTDIAGATNATLALMNVQVSQEGNYAVLITNAYGSLLSSNAFLTVNEPAAIQQQPAGEVVTAGGTATFTVVATGTGLSYQWLKDGFSLPNGGGVSGANTSTLTLSNVTPLDDGIYTVVITNVLGNVTSVYSVLRVWSPCSLIAWGDNSYGQTNVPSGLNNVVDMAAGLYFALALNTDGTVVAWGNDSYGQTNLPPGLTNVVSVSAGWWHGLALQADGSMIAWGYNPYGEASIPSGLTNIAAIAAGGFHNLALVNNGTVVAWGDGDYGQTNVPAGLSNVVAIAGGYIHSLALEANGTVAAWGDNDFGQCNVPANLTNAVAIAGGTFYSLALTAEGTVVAWGDNTYGECDVPAGLSNVVAIAAGSDHSLALTADGTTVAWGYNGEGQTNVPADSNMVAVAAGGNLSMALLDMSPKVDSTFNPSADGWVNDVAIQNNNSILIAGWFEHVDGQSRQSVARLNSDGSLDTAFNGNAAMTNLVDPECVAVDSIHRVYVGGDGGDANGDYGIFLRMDYDGNLDLNDNSIDYPGPYCVINTGYGCIYTFSGGGREITIPLRGVNLSWATNIFEVAGTYYGMDTNGEQIQISPNAWSYVDFSMGGSFTQFEDAPSTNVTDVMIGTVSGYDVVNDGQGVYPAIIGGAVNCLARDGFQNDSLLTGGYNLASTYGDIFAANASYGSGINGSSFTFSGGADSWVLGMAIQTNGEIVVGGDFSTLGPDMSNAHDFFGRFNANGTVDETFNPNPVVNGNPTLINQDVYTVLVQPNGKILVGWGGGLLRFNADGSLDNTFNITVNGTVAKMIFQPDGNLLIVGSFSMVGGQPHQDVARILLNP